jgi:hypothetical protein
MAFQIGDEPIFEAIIKEDGVVVDLTGATNLKLVFRKPTTPNTPIEVTATLTATPTDGKMRYDINGQSTVVLDDDGYWSWQPKGTLSSGRDFRGPLAKFQVKRNLS